MHVPVLLNQVLETLDPKPGETFVDGTTDGGGHMEAIIEQMGFKGIYIAVDLDSQMLESTRQRILEKLKAVGADRMNIVWANANYRDLLEVMRKADVKKTDKLLLDLGFSSEQLVAGRGFAYRPENAAEALHSLKEDELADIFWKYGEERFSRRVAKQIVMSRERERIMTVGALTECVKRAVPRFFKKGERDTIARVFQSLRIYVNGELESLESILQDLPDIVKSGGRAGIISFHSLEDRMVKNAFKKLVDDGKAKLIAKKPIAPNEEEIVHNPRSRSSKLRAIEII